MRDTSQYDAIQSNDTTNCSLHDGHCVESTPLQNRFTIILNYDWLSAWSEAGPLFKQMCEKKNCGGGNPSHKLSLIRRQVRNTASDWSTDST